MYFAPADRVVVILISDIFPYLCRVSSSMSVNIGPVS